MIRPVALILTLGCALFEGGAVDFFVSNQGNDRWSGRLAAPNAEGTDGPMATLARARDAVREFKRSQGFSEGAHIYFRGGLYEFAAPVEFTPEDSGTPQGPLVIRSYQNERVVFSGGRIVRMKRVDDPESLSRLPEKSRGQIWRGHLRDAGISNFGSIGTGGERPDLIFGDEPLTLSRWPNAGFARIKEVLGGKPIESHGLKGDAVGKFTSQEKLSAGWAKETEVWLHGYWFWDWSDSFQRVSQVDPETGTITLSPPEHGYGYRNGQRFYALNLLCELDQPGEWFLDKATGSVFAWPTHEAPELTWTYTLLPALIQIRGASFVTLQNIILEATRGTAVLIENGQSNQVAGCILRNTGSWAVSIRGGSSNRVIGNDIYQTGEGGIALSGGDRKNLTPAGHVAENNHVWNFGRIFRTYRPAVLVDGVGQRVAHNLIHDGPHNAIQLGGNDHTIEFNEIHHVCTETGDVGAFYMGRDWTARGTVIRHNFFHDLSGPGLHGAMAVYLDDCASGIRVEGNVFYRAGRAAFIGGGRDNVVENNLFVECAPSVHVDARGLGWMKNETVGDATLPTRLREAPYQSPPWSIRYPKLVNILDEEPAAPRGNVVARNISVGGRWLDLEKAAEAGVHFTQNLVTNAPGFIEDSKPSKHGFQLRDDSPAWKLGFKKIPIEQIGLIEDASRRSLPRR